MEGVNIAIYDFISENAQVQALMGVSEKKLVRCMPYNPKIDIKAPMITYYESDSDTYLNIPGCSQMTYRIDIWARNLEESTRLGDVIDDMLSVKDTSNDYARVLKFTLFTSGDTFDDQTKSYHKSLVYRIVAIDKTII